MTARSISTTAPRRILIAAVVALLAGIGVRDASAQSPGFAWTGSMGTPRSGHTATLLADGRVLVVGGSYYSPIVDFASAELYDPASGTFTPTGSMSTPRDHHTASLLPDGRVLIAGGRMLIPSELNRDEILTSVEIYDPATGTFALAGNMSTPRRFHTATPMGGGRVLFTGGRSPSYTPIASAEIYDSVSGTMLSAGNMLRAREQHTATLLPDSNVLIVGDTTDAEIYSQSTGAFTLLSSAAILPGWNLTATLLTDGQVLLAGGGSEAYLYNPVTRAFLRLPNLNRPRGFHSATLLPDGAVLLAGGDGYGTTEIYNPDARTFVTDRPMLANRRRHGATLLANGRVLMVGGEAGGATAELFTPGVAGPPTVNAGMDQTVTVNSLGAGTFTLSATAMGDFPPFSFRWSEDGATVGTAAGITLTRGAGLRTFTVVASDSRGLPSQPDTVVVTLLLPTGGGSAGPAGPTGATGATGPQGPQGERGDPGIEGVAGPSGPMGPAGPAGAVGAIGPQGPAGAPGTQGIAGTSSTVIFLLPSQPPPAGYILIGALEGALKGVPVGSDKAAKSKNLQLLVYRRQ